MLRPGIASFFFLTFLVTWGLQLPGVLSHDARLLPLAALGIFGPLAAATLLTARTEGRAGVRALYARLLPEPSNPIWYAIRCCSPARCSRPCSGSCDSRGTAAMWC